jgi:hypothetical protein
MKKKGCPPPLPKKEGWRQIFLVVCCGRKVGGSGPHYLVASSDLGGAGQASFFAPACLARPMWLVPRPIVV